MKTYNRNSIIFKTFAIPLLLTVFMICSAFKFDFKINENYSLKDYTNPHINTYYCTYAKIGDVNLLEYYDYFKITILDENELEVSYKKQGGAKQTYKCPYTYDSQTHQLSAECGILGYKYKQSTTIERGKFTISLNILSKPLVMIFEVK